MELTPFLMFAGHAEEAMRLYLSVFEDSEILDLKRYGDEGSIERATCRVANQTFVCIDSPVEHGFDFTPSVSFFVECESETQLDAIFEQLSDGGEVSMPLGEYPFARRFAWLSDRFGVSWQLNVAHHQ